MFVGTLYRWKWPWLGYLCMCLVTIGTGVALRLITTKWEVFFSFGIIVTGSFLSGMAWKVGMRVAGRRCVRHLTQRLVKPQELKPKTGTIVCYTTDVFPVNRIALVRQALNA